MCITHAQGLLEYSFPFFAGNNNYNHLLNHLVLHEKDLEGFVCLFVFGCFISGSSVLM